jgi:hypothetical protein
MKLIRSTPPSRTSWQAFLTLSFQHFRVSRITKQSTQPVIDTHLGGGTLGHLGLIISDAFYAMIAPTTDYGPTL